MAAPPGFFRDTLAESQATTCTRGANAFAPRGVALLWLRPSTPRSSSLALPGGRTGVADAVHLAGATRVHHTTVAMEVLAADSSAFVICEMRRAWCVIRGRCAATARCAGHGVCSCVGVCSSVVCDGCATLPEKFRFWRKSPKKNQLSLESMLVVSRQFDSLKSVLSLKHFLLNRSRCCTIQTNIARTYSYQLPCSNVNEIP